LTRQSNSEKVHQLSSQMDYISNHLVESTVLEVRTQMNGKLDVSEADQLFKSKFDRSAAEAL
jgi:hypothetical protein